MVFVVMGVSGCGKTTVGRLLAARIGFPFHDADDLHPRENIEKMSSGTPLTDKDRLPWLRKLARLVARCNSGGGGAVLACSALKKQYRDVLDCNGTEEVAYILLKGARDLIYGRLKDRTGHFFPPELLGNQIQTLEEPPEALVVSIENDPLEICFEIMNGIKRRGLLPIMPKEIDN